MNPCLQKSVFCKKGGNGLCTLNMHDVACMLLKSPEVHTEKKHSGCLEGGTGDKRGKVRIFLFLYILLHAVISFNHGNIF